jgi:hypothetical protein
MEYLVLYSEIENYTETVQYRHNTLGHERGGIKLCMSRYYCVRKGQCRSQCSGARSSPVGTRKAVGLPDARSPSPVILRLFE